MNVGYGERQLQDLPSPWESYGYTSLMLDNFTHNPFVGLEARISEKYGLSLEVGRPNIGITMESGHDRYNRREPIHSDYWEGYGTSVGLQLVCYEPEGDYEIFRKMVFRVRRESYDLELFDKEIDLDMYFAHIALEFEF